LYFCGKILLNMPHKLNTLRAVATVLCGIGAVVSIFTVGTSVYLWANVQQLQNANPIVNVQEKFSSAVFSNAPECQSAAIKRKELQRIAAFSTYNTQLIDTYAVRAMQYMSAESALALDRSTILDQADREFEQRAGDLQKQYYSAVELATVEYVSNYKSCKISVSLQSSPVNNSSLRLNSSISQHTTFSSSSAESSLVMSTVSSSSQKSSTASSVDSPLIPQYSFLPMTASFAMQTSKENVSYFTVTHNSTTGVQFILEDTSNTPFAFPSGVTHEWYYNKDVLRCTETLGSLSDKSNRFILSCQSLKPSITTELYARTTVTFANGYSAEYVSPKVMVVVQENFDPKFSAFTVNAKQSTNNSNMSTVTIQGRVENFIANRVSIKSGTNDTVTIREDGSFEYSFETERTLTAKTTFLRLYKDQQSQPVQSKVITYDSYGSEEEIRKNYTVLHTDACGTGQHADVCAQYIGYRLVGSTLILRMQLTGIDPYNAQEKKYDFIGYSIDKSTPNLAADLVTQVIHSSQNWNGRGNGIVEHEIKNLPPNSYTLAVNIFAGRTTQYGIIDSQYTQPIISRSIPITLVSPDPSKTIQSIEIREEPYGQTTYLYVTVTTNGSATITNYVNGKSKLHSKPNDTTWVFRYDAYEYIVNGTKACASAVFHDGTLQTQAVIYDQKTSCIYK
jgi:hypothetical protein